MAEPADQDILQASVSANQLVLLENHRRLTPVFPEITWLFQRLETFYHNGPTGRS
jgi:hypothetical protein